MIKASCIKIFGKILILTLTLLVLWYDLQSHFVSTNNDVAVIWAYKPISTVSYLTYIFICVASFILSNKVLFINSFF